MLKEPNLTNNALMDTPIVIQTKKHFKILDGLRGIAALAIVVFHFAEWIFTNPSKNFIGHGFLAVDFFFCLSGFVIAYAYDNRLGKMGLRYFVKRRLIRLHPLVVLGSVLGLLAFLLDPFSNTASLYSFGKTANIFICSILMIPFPVMAERSFNNFGLNAPAWSLFWEYIANIVYALVLYKLAKYIIYLLFIVAAAGLMYIAYTAGNLLGGWDKTTFWHGGVRIAYSFLAGLLVYRNNWIVKNIIGFILLSLILLLLFLTPHLKYNWIVELIIVLICFPIIVSLGAGSTLSPKTEKLCAFSGDISYPLYMTHYAGIWIFGNYFLTKNPSSLELCIAIIAGTLLAILLAYATMVFYDTPIRKYLSRRF